LSETSDRTRSPVLEAFRLVQHVAAEPGPVTLADVLAHDPITRIMAPSARLPLPQARRFVPDLRACAAALTPEPPRLDERATAVNPRPAAAPRAARATLSRRT
jgi:hypothetical protein